MQGDLTFLVGGLAGRFDNWRDNRIYKRKNFVILQKNSNRDKRLKNLMGVWIWPKQQ